MEYGIGCRRNLITAMFAPVDLASFDAVKFRVPSATFAGDRLRVERVPQPIQAYIVIREHFIEVLDGEFLHWAFGLFAGLCSHLIASVLYIRDVMVLTYKDIVAQVIRVVKGYSP